MHRYTTYYKRFTTTVALQTNILTKGVKEMKKIFESPEINIYELQKDCVLNLSNGDGDDPIFDNEFPIFPV